MFEFFLVLSVSYAFVMAYATVVHWFMGEPEGRSLPWSLLVGLVWPYAVWYFYRYMGPHDDDWV